MRRSPQGKGDVNMSAIEEALELHRQWNGKLDTAPKMKVDSREVLAVAYTPGVAEPCKVIAQDKEAAYIYTLKANTVAVVSDGSAVLGLGNIGPEAAMPVMEGKCVLFKEFGGVNAFPICLDTQDVDEIVRSVQMIAPTFGGINLEDISAPRCFEIERRLKESLDIPVFHDDQHGTAIVVLCGAINVLRLTGKKPEDCKVVVNGSGAAGIAIAKLMISYGFANMLLCDSKGIVSSKSERLNDAKREMLAITNKDDVCGTLADAMVGADIFVGVSAAGAVTPDMVKTMAEDAAIFAMANPTPEIFPDEAKAAGARIVATGRSDFPNQINNVIAFPGIFKGALEGRAKQITEEMKMAAAKALSSLVSDAELADDFIMPEPFDPRAAEVVSAAVKNCL
jgi:malate dehydrogenase (oxaloacetate-decarboxylating)